MIVPTRTETVHSHQAPFTLVTTEQKRAVNARQRLFHQIAPTVFCFLPAVARILCSSSVWFGCKRKENVSLRAQNCVDIITHFAWNDCIGTVSVACQSHRLQISYKSPSVAKASHHETISAIHWTLCQLLHVLAVMAECDG